MILRQVTKLLRHRPYLGWTHRRWIGTSGLLCRRVDYTDEKCNIYLMGSPGCGKTTVGKMLGEKLGRPVIDVDDDVLEVTWRMPVSQMLKDVGGDRFIQEEGKALSQLNTSGSVVCLSGSNPLHEESMAHIKKNGILVFLDVPQGDILARLEQMKVSRIVGQEVGVAMPAILDYRQSFYEKHHDVRVMCEASETPKNILNRVITCLERLENDHGYVSTRLSSHAKRCQFLEIVLQGLAPDGGLFVKADDIPVFSNCKQKRLVDMSYSERALRLLQEWINPLDIPGWELKSYIDGAYNQDVFQSRDIAPLRHLDGNQYLLELFHGPTASFKDFALQLMPQFFTKAVREEGENHRYLILVATSGDTGGAVLDGFRRYAGDGVGVLVFYPSQGISELQKHQMTTMEGRNIKVIGVDTDFDFCQSSVKRMFQDDRLANDLLKNYNVKLSAANSLNWGRLIPQIVYHASGYLELVKNRVISPGQEVDICVPTGNFGNILAAYYVKMMGFPIRRLICASNSNNVLTDFFHSGTYDLRNRRLLKTSSPAIDILKSSNLERLLHHVTGNQGDVIRHFYQSLDSENMFSVSDKILADLSKMFVAGSCSEEECQTTVVQTFQKTGYLLDPHTSVCKTVADRIQDPDIPVILAATAHNSKFAESVLPWIDPTSSINGASPENLLTKLSQLSKQPVQHEALRRMSSAKVIHTDRCPENLDDMVSMVTEFASKM